MENSNTMEPTRESIIEFVRKYHTDPESFMSCPLPAFGDETADEFGKNHGWDYVMATVRRMFN